MGKKKKKKSSTPPKSQEAGSGGLPIGKIVGIVASILAIVSAIVACTLWVSGRFTSLEMKMKDIEGGMKLIEKSMKLHRHKPDGDVVALNWEDLINMGELELAFTVDSQINGELAMFYGNEKARLASLMSRYALERSIDSSGSMINEEALLRELLNNWYESKEPCQSEWWNPSTCLGASDGGPPSGCIDPEWWEEGLSFD